MSKQDKKISKKKDSSGKSGEAPSQAKTTEKGKKIKEDLDNLMDKIDDVLEENAEEFVKNYVQKGGQ